MRGLRDRARRGHGTRNSRVALALLATVALATPAAAADWPTFGYDAARSGDNTADHAITKRNVGRLHERWQIALGAPADSTPIFLSRVQVGAHAEPMLFVTATSGATYGIDAETGSIRWTFATSGPRITQATPVADPASGMLYVAGVDGFVHAVDAATGTERRPPGFPVAVTLMPHSEKNASALNLANGYLYATTSGYIGDRPPYVGHLVAVRLSDGKTSVFNTLCSADTSLPTPTSCPNQHSGMWSRSGVVVDPDPARGGHVYVATGNGDFNPAAGDYGDSVLDLNVDATMLEDSYTPADYAALQAHDLDLGSTAPALLPREPRSRTPLMAVQGGKDRILRLLDRSHLGGVGAELQSMDVTTHFFSAPAVWSDGNARTWIFVGGAERLQAFRVHTGGDGRSALALAWAQPLKPANGEGTSPAIENGIVFVATKGALLAFDASNGTPLWSSAQPSAGGTIGPVHWQSPIVVGGSVYCTDQNAHLTRYALR